MGDEDILRVEDWLLDLLRPLIRAADSREQAEALLGDLGYAPPGEVSAFEGFLPFLGSLLDLMDAVESSMESSTTERLAVLLGDVLTALGELFRSFTTLPSSVEQNFAGSDFLTETDILTALPAKLSDYLIVRFLQEGHPGHYAAMALADIIGVEDITTPRTPFDVPYRRHAVNWDKVLALLTDPLGTLRDNIVSGNEILFDRLIYLVGELAIAIGVPASFASPDPTLLKTLNEGRDLGPSDEFEDFLILRSPLLDVPGAPAVDIYPVVDFDTSTHEGIGACVRFGSDIEIPISDLYRMRLKVSGNIQSGLGVVVGRQGSLRLLNGIFDSSPSQTTADTPLGFSVSIDPTDTDGSRELWATSVFPDLRMAVKAGSLSVGIENQQNFRAFVEADLQGGSVVIRASNPDGFLAGLLPADGIRASFDLGVGLSNLDGLYFKGSGGLEIQVPVHMNLGPVELHYLGFRIGLVDDTITAEITTGFSAHLGPLAASVEEMGVRAAITLSQDRSGNLGPLDVSAGFRPPSGVGLAIDAGILKGGGFLYFDAEREEYAGAVELVVGESISLKGIGLITTEMPDGSAGFSLLVIITADFGEGIQLGFGFALQAVGGLIGLNRTVKLEALAEAVRTGTANEVLFPHDVVANAPKIISDLRAIFPVQEGTFLIGPIAKITWGTPAMISLSLGVILEIPGDVAILGVLYVALPADDVAILVLQVNFMGVVEFDKARMYFFAALFESRVLFIPIEGEMGALFAFGPDANFVVSVGGFPPGFKPPPLPFPTPKPVSITLLDTDIARIRVTGYFCLTSNCVGFGARAEAYFGFDDLNVHGDLGFDALFQFSPFFFSVHISTSFSVDVLGLGLFGVGIRGRLEGATPFRLNAEGSISFIFFDIPVPVHVTWGESRDTSLPSIEIMPLLKREFEKEENWRPLLPPSNNLLVTLRPLPAGESSLIVHPVGVLRISQRLVPLQLTLDRLGGQRPKDVNRLSVNVTASGWAKQADALEQFAPAQYQDMSDADKLSRPAFAPEPGGVLVSAAGQLDSSQMVRRVARYEQVIIDSNYKRFSHSFMRFPTALFEFFLKGAAISKSSLSQTNKRQFQPFDDSISVSVERYSVVYQSTNKPYADDSALFFSEASALEYLSSQVSTNPNLTNVLHVLPAYEVAP